MFSKILPSLHSFKDAKTWEILKATTRITTPAADEQKWRRGRSGKPSRRWDDILVKVYGTDWRHEVSKLAAIKNLKNLRADFVRRACVSMKFVLSKVGYKKTQSNELLAHSALHKAKPKVHKAVVFTYYLDATVSEQVGAQICFCVDNETVANWVNGNAKCDDRELLPFVKSTINNIAKLHKIGMCIPRQRTADYVTHIYREKNAYADKLSKEALSNCTLVRIYSPMHVIYNNCYRDCNFRILSQSDGAYSYELKSGGVGIILFLSSYSFSWTPFCELIVPYKAKNSTMVEVFALHVAVIVVERLVTAPCKEDPEALFMSILGDECEVTLCDNRSQFTEFI